MNRITEFKPRNKAYVYALKYKSYVAYVSESTFFDRYNIEVWSGENPFGPIDTRKTLKEAKQVAKNSLEACIIVRSRKRPDFLRVR